MFVILCDFILIVIYIFHGKVLSKFLTFTRYKFKNDYILKLILEPFPKDYKQTLFCY